MPGLCPVSPKTPLRGSSAATLEFKLWSGARCLSSQHKRPDPQGMSQDIVDSYWRWGQDLDFGSVCHQPVGRVGLPHLIGQLGLEANPGGLGALVWLRLNQPMGLEDPPYGWPRWRSSEAEPEVVGDGLGAGVQARVGEPAR